MRIQELPIPHDRPTVGLEHIVASVDVDMVQINFTAYFRWMDVGFTVLLRQLGHPLAEILASGYATPVVDSRCNYHKPVALDDRVCATSWVEDAGRSSFVVGHRFEHEGTTVALGLIKHVWIATDSAPRPCPLPGWVRRAAGGAPRE